MGFTDEYRFCAGCGRYVLFLLSPEGAYCVECDAPVRMFSAEDFRSFRAGTDGAGVERGGGRFVTGAPDRVEDRAG